MFLKAGACTVKTSRRFYGKYGQLAASAFTVNVYGGRRTFAGITSQDGVRMCKLKKQCFGSHPYNVLYVTYPALHCVIINENNL